MCDKWDKHINEQILSSDPVGNHLFNIVGYITGEYVEISYCPFCGSKLTEKGCIKGDGINVQSL